MKIYKINGLGLDFVRLLSTIHSIMGTFTKTMHDKIQFDCLLSSILTSIAIHDNIQCKQLDLTISSSFPFKSTVGKSFTICPAASFLDVSV